MAPSARARCYAPPRCAPYALASKEHHNVYLLSPRDPFLSIALIDACERWWKRISEGEHPQPEPIEALA